jgi:hypothetical protein
VRYDTKGSSRPGLSGAPPLTPDRHGGEHRPGVVRSLRRPPARSPYCTLRYTAFPRRGGPLSTSPSGLYPAGPAVTGREGAEPREENRSGSRGEIGGLLAQLEQQRSRLEEVRLRARRQGGPEGERLEVQAASRLWEIEQRRRPAGLPRIASAWGSDDVLVHFPQSMVGAVAFSSDGGGTNATASQRRKGVG